MGKVTRVVLFAALVVAPVAFIFAAAETTPVVGPRQPGTAADAAKTRAIAGQVRGLFKSEDRRQKFSISQGDINSILAFTMRAWPFFRGQAVVTPDALRVSFSTRIPRFPGRAWLNMRAAIKPSRHGLRLASIRFGRFELPAGLVTSAIGFGLDMVLGDGLGTIAIGGVKRVTIDGDLVKLDFSLGVKNRRALLKRAQERARSIAGIGNTDTIALYYRALDDAARRRQLLSGGTFLPYLRLVLSLAHERAQDGNDRDEMRSALLALAVYCGHRKFQAVTGPVAGDRDGRRRSDCTGTTLAGRRDLRQHFVISAGLKATVSKGAAFAVGEFKELLDANRGGSGFSFDDLAADRAGIRLAAAFLQTGRGQWLRLIDLITSERAIFPVLSGLAVGLSEQEFERRYRDTDSPAYNQVLAEIETRIDRLDFFTRR